jgi:hypothetical protein
VTSLTVGLDRLLAFDVRAFGAEALDGAAREAIVQRPGVADMLERAVLTTVTLGEPPWRSTGAREIAPRRGKGRRRPAGVAPLW